MASSSVIARRYFDAIAVRDFDAAHACWADAAAPADVAGGAADDELTIRFAELFAAFPDLRLTLADTTTQRERCVLRWRATGTFLGPGRIQAFAPNGAQISIEGCNVLAVAQDRIVAGDFFLDGAELLQQLRIVPAPRSIAALANARTVAERMLFGVKPEAIAAGVWVLRGGIPRVTNVFLIEDEGGVTVFDSGPRQMTRAIRAAAASLGGVRQVVLGNADCDHRGGAAGLAAPVYCHPLERTAAESQSSYRDYWDLGLLHGWARPVFTRLPRIWDGGVLSIAGTMQEGDEVAGFSVIDLPGHAPGQIGLYRAQDGLALVSDCVQTIAAETGLRGPATIPPPAFNLDTAQARESVRRLAALPLRAVWGGHGRPVTGEDLELQLQRAAAVAV